MDNASSAKDAVFELFQDLDRFSLDDYAPLADTSEGMDRLVHFVSLASEMQKMQFQATTENHFRLYDEHQKLLGNFATGRDEATNDEGLELVGLDHPIIGKMMEQYRSLAPENLAACMESLDGQSGCIGIWLLETHNEKGQSMRSIVKLAVNEDGDRLPAWERQVGQILNQPPRTARQGGDGMGLLKKMEAVLEREIRHRGAVDANQPYSARLVGWIKVV
ncbi:MAG: hypothetical protein G8D91_18015 [gamma proteobacterium symbiont of Clathrolucina costata]